MSPSHRRRPGAGRGSAVIGILGEILLTLGALLILFLVWQLWWTDVIADREQSEIIVGLQQEWGEADGERIAPAQDGPPPVPEIAEEGMVWGAMHVPAFDREQFPVAEGVSLEEVLNVKGAGHYPQTALPGQVGNFSVAGHRNTYGRVFEDIARLQPGDPIVVETGEAFYVYEVTESLIVQPEDSEVIAPTPGEPGVEPTEAMATLTACHPMFSARERYIVHAKFAYWTDRAEGIPEALAGEAEPVEPGEGSLADAEEPEQDRMVLALAGGIAVLVLAGGTAILIRSRRKVR